MNAPLHGLAQDGVWPAVVSPLTLVRSYRTFSPLPALARRSKGRLARSPSRRSCTRERCRRYGFCATFRRVAPPGISPASCPAESGLSSSRDARRGRPTHSPPVIIAQTAARQKVCAARVPLRSVGQRGIGLSAGAQPCLALRRPMPQWPALLLIHHLIQSPRYHARYRAIRTLQGEAHLS